MLPVVAVDGEEAFDLFVGEPLVETEWDSSLAALGAATTDAGQRQLINLFGQLTPERRKELTFEALEDLPEVRTWTWSS